MDEAVQGGAAPSPKPKSELTLRVASAIVLALGAIGSAWWGGWVFAIVWMLLVVVLFQEWQIMTGEAEVGVFVNKVLGVGVGGLTFVGMNLLFDEPGRVNIAVPVLAVALLVGLVTKVGRLWAISGFVYSSALLASVILLRQAPQGFVTILFLFAVVWGADVGAYFAGRAIGGPKLAPRISPNKTWSGFFGGLITAILASLLLLAAFGQSPRLHFALLAAVLAVASVLGDLFESGMKRRFGVKDSGNIIPGHGGVMDRLDGFVFAAILAALVGYAMGGPAGRVVSPLGLL